MTNSYPRWKPETDRIGEYPYIEGCVVTDVIFIPISNHMKNRTLYIYITTEQAKELVERIKESIRINERVKGIRTQAHTMRWI